MWLLSSRCDASCRHFYSDHCSYYCCLCSLSCIIEQYFCLCRLLSDRAAKQDSIDQHDAAHLTSAEPSQTTGGELPLGYIAWLLYALVLSAKIGVIFGNSMYLVQRITRESTLDSSVLRTALSLSSIVFFTLVITHHDAPTKSERQVRLSCWQVMNHESSTVYLCLPG
jgi:CECR6/TMEM121 family